MSVKIWKPTLRSNRSVTQSPQQTAKLAAQLAGQLKKGDILCLCGDLGSGKTTFVKGIAQGLKIKPSAVNSPTFVLMNVHEGRLSLYHFDLYRLDDPKEVLNLGYEEFLFGDGVAVIEWAEKLGPLLPPEYLKIEFKYGDGDERRISFVAHGARYRQLLKQVTA